MLSIVVVSLAVVVAVVIGFLVWHVRPLFKGPDHGRLPAHYPFKSETSKQRYHGYCHERAQAYGPNQNLARRLDTTS